LLKDAKTKKRKTGRKNAHKDYLASIRSASMVIERNRGACGAEKRVAQKGDA